MREWAKRALPSQASLIDIGCGTGEPIARALVEAGFDLYGIDPSQAMLTRFRAALPETPVACETVQESAFFGRSFDAAVAIGVIFLLPGSEQVIAFERMAQAVGPGGHVLFSAPNEVHQWQDVLTGEQSRSLGKGAYRALLDACSMDLVASFEDSGGNAYHHAVKRGA
ncbi:class I SAM-dependent methyltransferase [Parerythrobacter jejuensis]|uniref:class I SAM-dependent methyltransferase n=1 Tax=Parerythrobacter jejuensis TaxID=795812 RepID=UPI002D80CBB4|nr:class I SAM-dependent methyltransferase [Parerythrobacter jejuensis]